MKRRVYTVAAVEQLAAEGQKRLVLSRTDLVTPAARDRAHELGIELIAADGGPTALPPWTGAAQDLSHRPLIGPRPQPTPPPAGEPSLEDQVRRVVTAMLAEGRASAPTTAPGPRGVRHVDGRDVTMAPFPFPIHRPEMDVRLQDVITAAHGSPMAAGFMSLHKGSFPWTLNYDEIEYVIEGELHIGTDRGVIVGRPGDVIYIPKGTAITFGTPSWAKFLYVTFPAEWAG
ncbi:MAG: cupin domain-containing protein [Caldilineales bacterium]|nr:cupin domain-containing protein [Caldilineales bacterium]